jgi:hypothetical protein
MDKALFESLLNEEESTSLDFKRDQYPFVKATDDEKSELLKDILAFGNAWRRSDAYILIGVEEVKGGQSKVVGVASHLSDSDLQQFVNTKTQKTLEFLYEAFSYNSTQVGIIKVPVQPRPFFLSKNYGKLTKDSVYIRRGSSTAIATTDEIIKMATLVPEDDSLKDELLDLIEELDHFIGAEPTGWHMDSRSFPDTQYQRLFQLGKIAKLPEPLRIKLREAYIDIKTIDRLCQSAWSGNYANRIETGNEATRKFPESKQKAEQARYMVDHYLQGL